MQEEYFLALWKVISWEVVTGKLSCKIPALCMGQMAQRRRRSPVNNQLSFSHSRFVCCGYRLYHLPAGAGKHQVCSACGSLRMCVFWTTARSNFGAGGINAGPHAAHQWLIHGGGKLGKFPPNPNYFLALHISYQPLGIYFPVSMFFCGLHYHLLNISTCYLSWGLQPSSTPGSLRLSHSNKFSDILQAL